MVNIISEEKGQFYKTLPSLGLKVTGKTISSSNALFKVKAACQSPEPVKPAAASWPVPRCVCECPRLGAEV